MELFRERANSLNSNRDRSGSIFGRERSASILKRKLDERKEPIWWRPLTIEGIEAITVQVDTVIKQFQDIHVSKDTEVAKVVPDFIRSIERRINELSRFYRENRHGR